MRDKQTNYTKLKKLAVNDGMALFGACDITSIRKQFLLPAETAEKFHTGISIGYRLSEGVLSTLTDAPNQLYYFHYQRANLLLDHTALKLCGLIQNKGFSAFPVPASQVIDWDKQYGVVSHREIARLAGHGWYGRNNLLVNPLYGSNVRFTSVLTDMPLKMNKEIKGNCGTCQACVSVCPSHAISQDGFDIKLCREKLIEFTKTKRIGQMICGVCIKACNGRSNIS
jgi:epoxyqueuosine reductase